jgi:hypothetical protein
MAKHLSIACGDLGRHDLCKGQTIAAMPPYQPEHRCECHCHIKKSPEAAAALMQVVEDNEGVGNDVDDAMGCTDCPEGCYVEPDGHCPHGYESAALSAGVI